MTGFSPTSPAWRGMGASLRLAGSRRFGERGGGAKHGPRSDEVYLRFRPSQLKQPANRFLFETA
jgi:hypothetical protein